MTATEIVTALQRIVPPIITNKECNGWVASTRATDASGRE